MKKPLVILITLISLTLLLLGCTAAEARFYLTETRTTVGNSITTEIFRYNSDGNVIEIERGTNGKITPEIREYNADGLLSYKKVGHTDNLNETYYTYDESGKVAEERKLLNGTPTSTVSYTYDDEGRVARLVSEGAFAYTEDYEYTDENGSVIVTRATAASTTTTETRYNDKGDEIAVITGSIETHTEYTYDENGRKISAQIKTADGTVMGAVRYTYDKHGNLTKTENLDAIGNAVITVENTYKENPWE